MLHYRKLYGLGLAILMLLALSSLVYAQAMTPSVTVNDQPITNDTVTVAKVVSNGPGWIVIHADQNGAPGPVLGYTAVKDGENDNVVVKLAAEGRTPTLYAMLHVDAGTVGVYEFPGADIPVTVNGAAVTPPFKVTTAAASMAVTPTVAAPAALPTTGGDVTPWTSILLWAVGALVLVGGLGLALAGRKR